MGNLATKRAEMDATEKILSSAAGGIGLGVSVSAAFYMAFTAYFLGSDYSVVTFLAVLLLALAGIWPIYRAFKIEARNSLKFWDVTFTIFFSLARPSVIFLFFLTVVVMVLLLRG